MFAGTFEGLTSSGSYDAVVASWLTDGTLLNVTLVGGTEDDYGNAIAAASDTIIVTGYSGSSPFYHQANSGGYQAFLASIPVVCPTGAPVIPYTGGMAVLACDGM